MNYLESWAHLFIIHIGIWFSTILMLELYSRGIPKDVFSQLKTVFVLALLMSLVSSHSHAHYLQYLK